MCENGDLMNHTAGGWMNKEDVLEGTRGMLVKVDEDGLKRERESLLARLAELYAMKAQQ